MENHKRNIAEKTAYDYERTIAKHLVPTLGGILLRDLEPEDIENYFTTRLAAGASIVNLDHHYALLHRALADAVRMKRLPSNPANDVVRPKRSKREMRILDEEQLRLFLGEAKRSSRYYRFYLMAVTTGMRQSELCGLKWGNVDMLTGQVSVQTVFYRLAGRQIWKEPKSATSRRSIALSPELTEELLTLKREQEARRRELGSLYHDYGLVFCQDNGKPLHAHNIVRHDFRRVLTLDHLKANMRAQGVPEDALPKSLPVIRFHDLRHSFASALLRCGTHMKVAQSILGHSGIAITMDLYSHLQPGMRDEALRAVSERLLAGAPSNQSSNESSSTAREAVGRGEKGGV